MSISICRCSSQRFYSSPLLISYRKKFSIDRYYRLFSTNDTPKLDSIERMLDCLEQNRHYDNYYLLARAPYLCSINNLENRFLNIIDRWWFHTRSIYRSGNRIATKPTSTVYHLGRLNQSRRGVVLRRLGPESIGDLLKFSSTIDFCSLPDRDDLTSYLTGIRDLVREPGTRRVAHANLIPRDADFFSNLQRYVVKKLESTSISLEKEKIDNSENEDWILSIRESMTIFILMRQIAITKCGQELLSILSDIAKRGLDRCSTAAASSIADRGDWCKIIDLHSLIAYADACLWFLRNNRSSFDVESKSPGTWDSWFGLFFAHAKNIDLSENQNGNRLRIGLLFDDFVPAAPQQYWNYLPQIAVQYEKIALFRSRFLDFRSIIENTLSNKEYYSYPDFARHLSDLIYDLGLLISKLSPTDRNLIADAIPLWRKLESAFIDLDPQSITYQSQTRTLTGFRDFRKSIIDILRYDDSQISEIGPSIDYYLFLSRWCRIKSETIDREVLREQQKAAADVATIMYLLKQIGSTNLPKSILRDLVRLFSVASPYSSRNYLSRCWSYFWRICVYYRFDPSQALLDDSDQSIDHSNHSIDHSPPNRYRSNFKNNDDAWMYLFDKTEEFMKNVSPTDFADHRVSTIEWAHFICTLPAAILVFRRFIDFRRISEIYVVRTRTLISKLYPRKAHDLARDLSTINEKIDRSIDRSNIDFLIQELKQRAKDTDFDGDNKSTRNTIPNRKRYPKIDNLQEEIKNQKRSSPPFSSLHQLRKEP